MWNSEATPRLLHLQLWTLEFLFLVDSRVSISLGRILGGFECATFQDRLAVGFL